MFAPREKNYFSSPARVNIFSSRMSVYSIEEKKGGDKISNFCPPHSGFALFL
jgi:hypothetical protein